MKNIITIISLLFLLLYVFLMSYYALWLGDDITYAYNFETGNRLSSITEVLPSQIWHYFNVNGRFTAHFLVQFCIAFLGKEIFAFINACFYLLFVYGILALTNNLKRNEGFPVTILLLILIAFQTKFVPTCQIGFIWTGCGVVWILYIYIYRKNISLWHLSWLIPLCFFVGWGQEAINVGVCAALFLYACLNYKRMTRVQWVIFIVFSIGTLLLIISPGSHKRLSEQHSISFLSLLPLSIYNIIRFSRCIYLLLIILVLCRFSIRKFLQNNYIAESYIGFYIFAALISLLMNFYISVYSNRQLFGIELMLLIIIVSLLPYLNQNIYKYFLGVMILIFSINAFSNFSFLKREIAIYKDIESQYKTSETGIAYVNLESRYVNTRQTDPCDGFGKYTQETLSRLFRSRYCLDKDLYILPNCTQINEIIRPANGQYFIYLSKNHNIKTVEIQRAWDFGICKYSKGVYKMDLYKPVWENDSIKAYQFFVPSGLLFDSFGEAMLIYQ